MFFKRKETKTFLVVGLGNPGREYERSRHNCGFWALDALAERHGVSVSRSRFRALCGEARLFGARVVFMKPMTFMNLSGVAVHQAVGFYKIPPERVVVLSDDAALAPGALRIRASGSAGGQNGLKNIIAALKTEQFPRVRIGVGAPPRADYDLADWVLARPSAADMKKIQGRLGDAADAVELIVAGKLEEAQGRFN